MFLEKIASVLAVIIAVMAIRVSAKAMLGWQPGWKVVPWLPVYNFVMGILSLVPAVLLWINHPFAWNASFVIFAIHTVVLLLLLTVFPGKVAQQSVRAMTFRVFVWIAILALTWFGR
jgi:hypothetical protein